MEANAGAPALLVEADARVKSSILLAHSMSEPLAIIKSAGGDMTQMANDYVVMRLLQQIAEPGGRTIVPVGQLGQTPIMIQPGEG